MSYDSLATAVNALSIANDELKESVIGFQAGAVDALKSDLASTTDPIKGAATVVYLPEWTGAVARRLNKKLQERVSPYDGGAIGGGVVDDSAAFAVAISRLASKGGGILDLCGDTFKVTNLQITDKHITIENGVLHQSEIVIGPDAQVADAFDGGLQEWRDMFCTIRQVKFTFPFTVTTAVGNRRYDPRPVGNNPIKLQRCALVDIKDNTFINCNAPVSSVAKDAFQHVRQFSVTGNTINYCNYIFYGNYIDNGTNLLQHGDCLIDDNIAIPCLIQHVMLQGQDGYIVSRNVCFFPSFPFTYSVKKQNIVAYKCAHGIIRDNELFEAGEEGILLNKCGRSTIGGNQIIWPGQRLESSGIKYTGGSLSSDEFLLGTNGTNVIWNATKYGIEFDTGTGHVAVGTNIIRGTGVTTFYFGPAKVFPVGYAIYAPNTSKKINCVGNISDTPNWLASVGGWFSANIESPDASVSYARTKSSKLTLTSTATTIDITHYDTIALQQPSATTVLNFVYTGDYSGLPSDQLDKEITLIAFNGNTTVAHGQYVKLRGGVNRTIANEGTMKLRYFAGIWYEV